ncbi:MAG: zinc-ribbon domain containing protein, partial [Candidatus Riflebacteria bacterium]|nr:zinc-ribbon domain containing protein [Candidatus Riflebacteria bacterium]
MARARDQMSDLEIACEECKQTFVLTDQEQAYYT